MAEEQETVIIEHDPLNSTLQKLDSSMEQQTATTIMGLNLPSFSGSQNEDINEFIRRFKLATFVLSEKHRCMALNKCLTGTANTWAKMNIKRALVQGQWKVAKRALIDRFGPLDTVIKLRQSLNSLRYQESQSTTVLGFVEKFVALYRKAYVNHSDSDAIISLRLNLPNDVIKGLNSLDDGWTTYTSCSELYKLVRRYEENIKPYDEQCPSTAILDQEAIKALIKQLRNEST